MPPCAWCARSGLSEGVDRPSCSYATLAACCAVPRQASKQDQRANCPGPVGCGVDGNRSCTPLGIPLGIPATLLAFTFAIIWPALGILATLPVRCQRLHGGLGRKFLVNGMDGQVVDRVGWCAPLCGCCSFLFLQKVNCICILNGKCYNIRGVYIRMSIN